MKAQPLSNKKFPLVRQDEKRKKVAKKETKMTKDKQKTGGKNNWRVEEKKDTHRQSLVYTDNEKNKYKHV